MLPFAIAMDRLEATTLPEITRENIICLYSYKIKLKQICELNKIKK